MIKNKVIMLTMAFLLCIPVLTVSAVSQDTQGSSNPVFQSNDILIPKVPSELSTLLGGEIIDFQQKPYIINGSTLAPHKDLFEKLGFDVEYDHVEQMVTGNKEGLSIQFIVGNKTANVNGKNQSMPLAPETKDGEMFIPLRFLAETDGREVLWAGHQKQVRIGQPHSLHTLEITLESNNPWSDDDPFLRALEEETNTILKWVTIPSEHYQPKINTMIAAGQMSDVMLIKDPLGYDPDMFQSLFWDLSPYIADYPNLQKVIGMNDNGLRTRDGGIVGIPKMNPIENLRFPAVRQDWLDRLGFNVPTNTEELQIVLEGFTQLDPDGNGKNDTFGLAGTSDSRGLGDISWLENIWNGSNGRFTFHDNEEIIDTILEPGTLEALNWLNEAYTKSLISKEFPVLSSEQARTLIEDGKAGIASVTLNEAAEITEHLKLNNPDAQFLPLLSLQSANGLPLMPSGPVYSGMYAIPKQVTEAKLKNILAVFDALYASAGSGDALTHLSEHLQEDLEAVLIEWRRNAPVWGNHLPGWLTTVEKKSILKWDEEIMTTKLQIILGEQPLEQWNLFIEKIKADKDYQEIMTELN